MIVALTGTPGTGKSTVSKLLRNKKYQVLDLNKIVLSENLVLRYDDARQTAEVDLDGLNKYLIENLKTQTSYIINNDTIRNHNNTMDEPVFLEGHIAHLLNIVDLVIVLRCHPTELRHRLVAKGWSEDKLRENLEAEAVDAITIESIEKFGQDKIFEINTTAEKPSGIVEKILEILNGNVKGYEPGKIDWSEEILKWY
jgi:adenylate kinase